MNNAYSNKNNSSSNWEQTQDKQLRANACGDQSKSDADDDHMQSNNG